MKTFESLFAELSEKAATKQAGSLTVDDALHRQEDRRRGWRDLDRRRI